MEEKKLNILLKQQLDQLLTTLSFIPAAKQTGNAAYYLERLASYVSHLGADEPMVASIWMQEDLEWVAEQRMERDVARQVFAQIDRNHDAIVGINWDVLSYALDQD
ncbi:hypothetical protein [Thiolinea disciformis]|uniref:hypothetical protein n=1 Tax=Thiolinea disciformis TaxID=125614 RepID=UPI00036CE420|nr:hypothetical protein [Thiolinea disciformis]